jgi:hypothetical protein
LSAPSARHAHVGAADGLSEWRQLDVLGIDPGIDQCRA